MTVYIVDAFVFFRVASFYGNKHQTHIHNDNVPFPFSFHKISFAVVLSFQGYPNNIVPFVIYGVLCFFHTIGDYIFSIFLRSSFGMPFFC